MNYRDSNLAEDRSRFTHAAADRGLLISCPRTMTATDAPQTLRTF